MFAPCLRVTKMLEVKHGDDGRDEVGSALGRV